MPSSRCTLVEITPEPYLALDAEATPWGTALKKLASEIIMNGVSEKAVGLLKQTPIPSGKMDNKKLKGGVANTLK